MPTEDMCLRCELKVQYILHGFCNPCLKEELKRLKGCSHITLHNFSNLSLDSKCKDCKKSVREIIMIETKHLKLRENKEVEK